MDYKTFSKKYHLNRHNTDSIKWEEGDKNNALPMWIADVDFKLPESIISKIASRIKYGDYGYSHIPNDFCDVMISYYKEYFKTTYKKDWIRFSRGAVDGIYQVINSLTKKKDGVMILEPVYHPFSQSVIDTERKLVVSQLIHSDKTFKMDYEDIEKKIIKNKVKLIIFCSPHNPLGIVWSKQEMCKLFDICVKHNVLIISDEVHADIIMPGYKFTSALSLSKYKDHIITINSVSKTFSIAIYQFAHVIIPNKELRDKFDSYRVEQHRNSEGALNAYPEYLCLKEGREWFTGLLDTIYHNYLYFTDRFKNYDLDYCELKGTYLIFVDFKAYLHNQTAADFLLKDCHILCNAGEAFGKEYGSWARINLATTPENIKKACDQIEEQLKKLK